MTPAVLLQDHATPLHLAALWGRTEVVRLLLNRGAAVNAADKVRGRGGGKAWGCVLVRGQRTTGRSAPGQYVRGGWVACVCVCMCVCVCVCVCVY